MRLTAGALRVTALSFALALSSCISPAKSPSLLGGGAPARVVSVTSDGFSFTANAYVDLHTWLLELAKAETSAAAPEPLWGPVSAYGKALAKDETGEVPAKSTRDLARCIDDRCALAALEGTGLGAPFAEALRWFVAVRWEEDAGLARAAIGREVATAPEAFALAAVLARDLAIAWPNEPVTVDIVAHAARANANDLEMLAVDTRATAGVSAIECALERAARSLSDASVVLAAIELERVALDSKGRARTRALSSLVVVHAVEVVVAARFPAFHGARARVASRVDPDTWTWLEREWPARRQGEDPKLFAARAVAAMKARP